MEMLDYYDEYMNFLGTESRDVVHSKGLWHKTVHCWLYDANGNIYFQIRADSNKGYTTASGHVMAGESVKDAFHREIMEEIGVSIDISNASLVEINSWKMDKVKNGNPFKDRAFANVYVCEIDESNCNFNFDETEVNGIIKINASECMKLFLGQINNANAYIITQNNKENKNVTINDFLVMNDEIHIIKYGKILQEVVRLTK